MGTGAIAIGKEARKSRLRFSKSGGGTFSGDPDDIDMAESLFKAYRGCPPRSGGHGYPEMPARGKGWNGALDNLLERADRLRLAVFGGERGDVLQRDETEVRQHGLQVAIVRPGVRTIGVMAFHVSPWLRCVLLPDGLERIEKDAFWNCSRLEAVIPVSRLSQAQLEALGEGEIPAGMSALPDSVTAICEGAFHGCMSLEKLALPAGLQKVDRDAFGGCPAHANEILRSPDGKRMLCASSLTGDVVVPEGVEEIVPYAFAACPELRSVRFPSTLRELGGAAFRSCENLVSVDFRPGVKSIGSSAFACCKLLASVSLPEGLEKIGRDLFRECESLVSVELPESLKERDYGCCGEKPVRILKIHAARSDHPYFVLPGGERIPCRVPGAGRD